MHVLWFLKERTTFIRRFYEQAGEPFREIMRKIEASEAPFDDPPYSEDGEPPFLVEWSEAHMALEVLGRTCVSMLSASIQLYFKCWEAELGVTWKPGERENAFKSGFIEGYKVTFGELLGLDWGDCPVDFGVLEQVNLARNRDQHPDDVTSMRITHDRKTRERFSELLFVSESDRKMFEDPDMAGISWMSPAVHVSREALFTAIEQVEKLGEWLEERMFAFMLAVSLR